MTAASPTHAAPVVAGARLASPRTSTDVQPGGLRSLAASVLPVALVLGVSLAPLVGYNIRSTGGLVVLCCLAALTTTAAFTRQGNSVRLGLALMAMVAAFALPWEVSWWPLPGAIGVVVYVLSGAVRRAATPDRHDLGRGSLAWIDLAAILGLSAVSASALIIFHNATPPRAFVGDQLLAEIPTWLFAGAGLLFVTVNAAVEELLFRGVLLHRLRSAVALGPAVAIQAFAFGMLHLHGYPYGLVGVALAGIYGLMLAMLRIRSGGLLAPWLAHVFADSVIFVFIVQNVSLR